MKKLVKTKVTDIRGKEFIQSVWTLKDVIARYFKIQVKDYVDYVRNNPQMFVTVQEFKKSFKKVSDENYNEIVTEIVDVTVWAHIQGQNFTEQSVQKEIDIGLTFNINNDRAKEWAANNAWLLIRGIDQTTQEEISNIISDSIDKALSLDETAKIIDEKFAQYSEYRASLIANMEIATAFAEGKDSQFSHYQKYFQIEGYKSNYDQGDGNVRPEHRENTLEGWIPYNQKFAATDTLREPHDFNCRCVTRNRLTKPAE